MRTESTWRSVRALAPAVLLGTITGLALQGCVNVQVRVDPAPTVPSEPTAYYGVVENTGRWTDETESPVYDAWEDCSAS